MKVDLGVVSATDNDYDDVITKLDDIKERIKNTESELSDKGWTGEAQKKYTELVKWFLEKDYACLEENLKCMKEVLSNVVQSQGGALKNRCEDFANCFDGSERGAYPEGNGESAGILSLEYDNSASVIDNVTEITDRLIAHKRAALEDLSKTIRGGWFSSGLIFSSLNIDNELAESSNEIFNEQKRLNAFLQSFIQYTPGVKRLEESVCSGLNKVKNLEKTALSQEGMKNIDASAKLGTIGKVGTVGKSLLIDVGGGFITLAGGVMVVSGCIIATPFTDGLSDVGVPEGSAMAISGGNTFLNGGRDLIREMTGYWGDVGSTNFAKDKITDTLKDLDVDAKTADLVGSGVVTGVDIFGSKGAIFSSAKDTIKIGKNAIIAGNNIYNDYKLLGTSYKIINATTGDTRIVNLADKNVTALIKVAPNVALKSYNDAVSYYSAKTINDDITPMFGIQNEELPYAINSWLENDTWKN